MNVRRASINLLALVVALLLAGNARAGLPPGRKPLPKLVYIELVSTDPVAMTFTIQPKNSMATEAKTYKLAPGAAITLYGKPATLADLKPGLEIHFHLAAADPASADQLSASPPPRGSE